MPGNDAAEGGRPQDDTAAVSYRGGFSTSISDGLFEEHGHSDCCVLTCCGILLFDRNVFLLTNKRPSWRGRCGVLICFCLLAVLFLGATLAATYLYAYEIAHLKELEREGNRPTKADEARIDEVKKLMSLANICRISIWALAFYLLCKAAQYRYRTRRFLVAKLYEERNEGNETDVGDATAETPLVGPSTSEEMTTFLAAEKCNMCCATAPLGCISKDDIVVDPSNSAAAVPQQNAGKASDLCHCLWKTLTAMCCGGCLSCWCQCLGLCAIAQEDRELQRMLPQSKFQVDYITFQPYADYFPKLEALRQNKINNILAHFSELSQLSHHLCRTLLVALVLLTVLAFSGYDPLFQPAHLVVVYMTFLQAFLIIYLVHWMWNRFDLSFDAIVKYFASGFILCTANAFVYETFVSTTISATASVVRALLDPTMSSAGDDDQAYDAGADDAVGDDATAAPPSPIWLLGVMAFLNAFAVAAMVEEISKYFGYWMVEHPDLTLPDDKSDTLEGDVEPPSDNGTITSSSQQQQRTLKSLGAGITVAMVTTAVGFACCENFMYVFIYSRSAEASNQLATLVARSIFPVHPLAAAIQSIGVCRRDVEKDSAMKFGRILLPALLLHGSFDFALMFLDLSGRNAGSEDGGETGAKFQGEPGAPLDDPSVEKSAGLGQVMPALVSSVTIVLLAVAYYIVKALAQRRRLEELDRKQQGRGEYTPLL